MKTDNKITLSNEKIIDLLPYFASMGEKLTDDMKKVYGESEGRNTRIGLAIAKNAKKIKPELIGIVSEILEITVVEAKKMSILKTIKVVRELLKSEEFKEIINFTGELSSAE